MILRRITPPLSLVTLAEAKTHCDVVHDGLDTVLSRYIAAAIAHVDGKDGILGRALGTQTWEVLLPEFPASRDKLRLPLPPLQSITAIEYRDAAGALQTLSSEEYRVIPGDDLNCGAIPVNPWPDTEDAPDAVRVEFVAGYGAPDDVPSAIHAALLLMIRDLLDNPASGVAGPMNQNPAVDSLLFPHRTSLIS